MAAAVICASCGKESTHEGRGMDQQCYDRERRRSRLDDWPSVRNDHDDEVVNLLVSGFQITASCRERREAIGILLARRQFTHRQIADRIGVSNRTVERVAAKIRSDQHE
jgi:DNA-directed RNA polymerase specialized sigma24 family protein